MTSASIAPLTAQTKQQIEQLPRGCAYMRVPVLESPFPRPARYPEEPLFKDGINLTRVVAPPQFLLHSLPSPAKSLLSPTPALFPETPSGFIMVCGLHLANAQEPHYHYWKGRSCGTNVQFGDPQFLVTRRERRWHKHALFVRLYSHGLTVNLRCRDISPMLIVAAAPQASERRTRSAAKPATITKGHVTIRL
jgi:hypothetical protein